MKAHALILYLSYDGLTDPLGQSQILPYILGLEKKGYRFKIISFEKPKSLSHEKAVVEALIAGREIVWLPKKYHKKPPIFSTVLDLCFLWLAVKKEHRRTPFDIIHCRSYITSLVGLLAKKKLKTKFIFDMRGFWADERVEGGLWNLKNPIFRLVYDFFKNKEKRFLLESDHVVSLTYNAKEVIESWRINNAPITVIPTCVDLELFDPAKIKNAEKNALRQRLGLNFSDFVLLYSGSWGTWYLTIEMLDFFSKLKKQKPCAKFLILSPDKIELKDYPHDDVIITFVERRDMPLYISLANAAVFFIKPSFSKKASSATKMGEILAMNVPVVTNRGWGDVEGQSKTNSVFFAISDLMNSAPSSKDSGRNYVSKFLSLDKGIQDYSSIYQTVLM